MDAESWGKLIAATGVPTALLLVIFWKAPKYIAQLIKVLQDIAVSTTQLASEIKKSDDAQKERYSYIHQELGALKQVVQACRVPPRRPGREEEHES